MYADDRTVPRLRHLRHTPLSNGHRPEMREVGRRCTHPQCDTLLSRYNPSDTCAAHAGWQDSRARHRV